jgi:hypothetical protein
MNAQSIPFALASSIILALSAISYAEDNDDAISSSRVQQGFDISPVPKTELNFAGKDPARVGLGSYLVNAVGGCSGCHTFPQYLEKGDPAGSNPTAGAPFEGTPLTQSLSRRSIANYNVSHFLAGGRCFGPGFMSFNITPDATGRPLGKTSIARNPQRTRSAHLDPTLRFCRSCPGQPFTTWQILISRLSMPIWRLFHPPRLATRPPTAVPDFQEPLPIPPTTLTPIRLIAQIRHRPNKPST